MFDDCIRNEQRKLACLHKIGQQKGVLSSKCGWIKHTDFDVNARAPNGKSSSVQVPNAAVWLEHVMLKGYQPKFLGPADQVGAVSDEPQLKAVVLGCVNDSGSESGETVRLKPAVSIHE